MNRSWMLFVGGLLALTAACNRKVATNDVDVAGNGRPIPSIQEVTATDQPTIRVANWEETQQLVAQNSGKIVILDLWASW